MESLGFVLLGLTLAALFVTIILFELKEHKREKEVHKQVEEIKTEVNAIEKALDKAVKTLLRGLKTPNKEIYDKATIECRIFALQYFRVIIADAYNQFANEYEDAVMETYKRAAKYGFKDIEQFADYFEKRCRQYGLLHYDIVKKKKSGEKSVPFEYMGFIFLICEAPLKDVDDTEIHRSLFDVHNDFFVLISFSLDVTDACKCIFDAFAEYIVDTPLDDEDEDEVISHTELEKEIANLLKEYSKEDAIDIIIERLSAKLDARKKEGDKSLETYDAICTYCEILDTLSPLGKPHRYSNIKDEAFLVEILTIEYNHINDAAKAILKLGTRAKVRGWALLEISCGPKMDIDANKLLREADMYNEASLHLLNYKSILGTAALSRKIARIPEKAIKSSLTYLIDGYVLGLIHEGKLHLTPEFPIDSLKGPFHLYTYLWLEDMKISNYTRYKSIIKYAMTSEYFYHIWNSDKFSDLTEDEAAVKSFCYMVASQGSYIFFNEKEKNTLMTLSLAKIPYPFRVGNILQSDMPKLPIISFIRGDKVNTYKGNETISILRRPTTKK